MNKVVVGKKKSSNGIIFSRGVPQESIMGHLLFFLYTSQFQRYFKYMKSYF